MKVIRCTKKATKALGLAEQDLTEVEFDDRLLDEWYCHLLTIDHRKVMLLTHAASLYSFVILGLRKAELRRFPQIFSEHLHASLVSAGVARDSVQRVCADAAEVRYSKPRDRRVLGSMNDLAYNLRFEVHRCGGIDRADALSLGRGLNEMPMGLIGMKDSAMCLRERLQGLVT